MGKFSTWQIENNFSYFFKKNRLCHFMQTVSSGDSLHELSKPISDKNKIFFFFLNVIYWNFYPTCYALRRQWWLIRLRRVDMLKSTFEADMKSSKSSNFCLTLSMLGKKLQQTTIWNIVQRQIRLWHFMQGDNLHEMSKPIFWEK